MQVTNLSNVLFFSEKNKVFKKKNKTFSLKEQELFKIWPVVFSITASTCRNALFFLQIFQPFRKRPAHRHSGWRICIVKCFSRKISFRKIKSLRIGGTPVRLKDSRVQSFSRNADGQGVCGKNEGFEGFFKVFYIEYYERPYLTFLYNNTDRMAAKLRQSYQSLSQTECL